MMMNSKTNILETVKEKILVLDGAMGTMLQKEQLDEAAFRGHLFEDHPVSLKGLNDLLVLTRPDIVENIYKQYLDAGADIITANTFNANKYGLQEYRMEGEVYRINYEGIKQALQVAAKYNELDPEKPRYVAGSLGPTGKTASISPSIDNPAERDVTFDDLAEAYGQQAEAMIDAGVDVLMVETVFDTLNAKAVLYAIRRVLAEKGKDIPVMASVTIDESGRNLSGQTVEAFYNSFLPFSLFSIGLNCSFGADKMLPYLERLSEKSKLYVSTHPNAGLPNELGEYDQSPAQMAGLVETFCEKGLVNIAGGCCGSMPEHIQAIADVVKKYTPRKQKDKPRATRLSGLQSFGVRERTRLVKVAERTNVTGSRKFARLIRDKQYEDALEIARSQIQDGGQMLNINLDESMIDTRKVIVDFLNYLTSEPDIVNVPVMIDSSDFDVLRNGLKCLQGRSVVNSISLKDGEADFKEKAQIIKGLGAVLVVMAFDEEGQAETFDRKIEICSRAYTILTETLNYPPEDIIFDPNVLTIGTGIEAHNSYALDFIRSVEWIKANLPYAKVNAGVSNVSFAFRGNDYLRDVINSVFLHHCEVAGLDFAIVNPPKVIPYQDIPEHLLIPVEDLIFNRQKDATDRLVNMAANVDVKAVQTGHKDQRETMSPEERIAFALTNGLQTYITDDIQALKEKYENPLDIIQGPLMDGMNKVGELFGEGKMFLPQVIKSARIMNKAVDMLTGDIEAYNMKLTASASRKKKLLLATVEGDVHDIGKNIVSLIFRCNNYEVIDMGVMVPNKDVVEAVEREQPDILGLSGLISPSLDKMIEVLKLLEDKGLNVPVFLGGAATSGLHTAVKAAPHYSGVVAHLGDAAQSVTAANGLLGENHQAMKDQITEKQQKLRASFRKKKAPSRFISLKEARKRKYGYKPEQPVKPNLLGTKEFSDFDLRQLRKYIDWTPFFHGWGLKGKYPSIFEKERMGAEAERLFNEALEMLDDIQKHELIRPRGIIGIFPANSDGDDVLIFNNDKREKMIMRIPMLRQQQMKDDRGHALSLADFIAPVDSGVRDYFGGFAVTTGLGIDQHLERFREEGDSYSSIMFRLLADRLVEAAAEVMHEWVRKKYWGYVPDEDLSIEELLKGKFKGIRPAVGYPACPDHSIKKYLFDLLDVEAKIGVSLTEIYAMKPASSVSGFYMANDASRYFGVGKIGQDQVDDYARRSGNDVSDIERWLHFDIAKDK